MNKEDKGTYSSPVVVHDGVQPVGDGDNSTASKLIANGLLDEVICFHVNCSSGLIKHQNLGFPQQSSCKTHKLALPHTAGKEEEKK